MNMTRQNVLSAMQACTETLRPPCAIIDAQLAVDKTKTT